MSAAASWRRGRRPPACSFPRGAPGTSRSPPCPCPGWAGARRGRTSPSPRPPRLARCRSPSGRTPTPLRAGSRPWTLSELELFADFFGDANECAGARSGEGVFGPDLTPLEPVEHLLHADLDLLELLAPAGEEDRRRRDAERRRRRHGVGRQDRKSVV